MSRKYGKSKLHGGAGLQFDKLLKACSNSKKPSVTKTAGALGRFGIASFTSTRNANFDADSCGEESERFTSFKRPRLDVERNLAELRNDSFRYGENLMSSQQMVPAVPPPIIIKPKKFFKSRNLDNDQEQGCSGMSQPLRSESNSSHLPTLPMPITIPNPRLLPPKQTKSNGKKGRHRRRESTSGSETESKCYNTSYTSPPDLELGSKSSKSPSIKLRIFKDKKTSKFVSVSDTSLPPKLEPQIQGRENICGIIPKKRGRKPKADKGELEPIEKVKAKKGNKTEPVPQRRSGRLTRNSRRLRSSDSAGEMPVLRAVDDDGDSGHDGRSETELTGTPQYTDDFDETSHNVKNVDFAEKLVQRLEQEDSEFRELTAMLSSMEGSSESNEQMQRCQPAPLLPHSPNHYQESSPMQPSPINYSRSTASPPKVSEPEFQPASTEAPVRDFRSMLEDEWDDHEEESPRKFATPTKVSRFHMPEFMTSPPLYNRNQVLQASPTMRAEQLDYHANASHTITHTLNSSYAVRNLLSEITGTEDEAKPLVDIPLLDFPTTEIDPAETDEEPPCAPMTPEKIILTKESNSPVKKGSIFKSRINTTASSSEVAPNPKKRLALYKHKFGQETTEKQEMPNPPSVTRSTEEFDEDSLDDSKPLSLCRRAQTDEDGNEIIGEGSKVYCSQNTKKLFTVVRNVKAIHELQESGEVHEFDGDIWYILEDLKESNSVSSRCLSAITLATRCMEPAFRMHLRAHGTVAEFSRELHDAPNIPVLALAAATVLFVLSQDRLNMDLDTESFQLILALAKTEQNPEVLDENPELSKHKQRIIDLVAEMKTRGHATHIKIEKITASELALETMLFLTSKRAGEWIKQELRSLGGLDYIVAEVEKSMNTLEACILESDWTEVSSDILWKIDRCLKVLQQVTFNHEENQKYLLGKDSQAPEQSPADLFVRLFKFLSQHLSQSGKDSETLGILREILFSVLRVLVNLTHDYRGIVFGSEILSSRADFLNLTLHSVFTLSTAFSDGKGFDLLMHSLCMLLNIVEHSHRNRELVLSMSVQVAVKNGEPLYQPALDALIALFFRKESEAQKEEASTDDILTNSTEKKDTKPVSTSESQSSSQESKDSESSSVQDIIDKLIETAGKHMENSMIGAHISLLIAYLIMNSEDWTAHVRNSMPDFRFLPLMVLLKKLFNFMSITTSTAGSTRGLKATSIALKFFEKCDPESAAELKKIIPD